MIFAFASTSIASAASPPSQAHAWCDAGCGESYTNGASAFISDVPWNKCLKCSDEFIETECSLTSAPYKGWVDATGGVRETSCAWTGCAASNAGCDAGANETVSETTQCTVDEGAGGSTEGTNLRCCLEKPLWTCCGVLACSASPASPPPPPPPPASPPSPPPPPFPPPPPPAKWGWKLGSDDDVLDGEVVFVSSAADVAMSGDGTRIAIGAPYANETPGFSSGRRARVFQYQSGRWDKIGSDLLGDGKNDGFANKLCLSNDGTRVVIAAKTSGVNDTGLVQVYDEKGGNWTQVAEDLTGDDDFVYYGSDVAISKNTGERVFVAGGKRSLAGVSGVVRAYEVREASGDPEDNIREWVQVGNDLLLASPNISLGVSDDALHLAVGTPLSSTARVFK